MKVRGEAIELVSEYKYVGVWFTSTVHNIFAVHHCEKATKVHRVACTTFTLDAFIGVSPPTKGKMLYMARVDPILMYRCNVVLNVNEGWAKKLADIQLLFIQCLLGVRSHSMIATLFMETGLMPLRVQHVQFAISYLMHLLQLPHCHYAYAALQESKELL